MKESVMESVSQRMDQESEENPMDQLLSTLHKTKKESDIDSSADEDIEDTEGSVTDLETVNDDEEIKKNHDVDSKNRLQDEAQSDDEDKY